MNFDLRFDCTIHQTQTLLDEQLLPSLRNFVNVLKTINDNNLEVEALVRALLEELEEIVRDAKAAKNTGTTTADEMDDDKTLETEPSQIYTRLAFVRHKEKLWLRGLPDKLSTL